MRGINAFPALAVLALAVATSRAGPPTVEIPSQVVAKDEYVILPVGGTAKAVTFKGLSGVEPVPPILLKDATTFVLNTRGLEPKTYLFFGVASLNDEHKSFTFEVVVPPRVPPVPIPPGPQPGPPNPVPPGPVDPTTKAISDAYALETSPDRRERFRALQAVMADTVTAADKPEFTNTAELAFDVSKRRTAAVGDALPEVRKAIGGILGSELGQTVFTLDADGRTKVKAAYRKVSEAMKGAVP